MIMWEYIYNSVFIYKMRVIRLDDENTRKTLVWHSITQQTELFYFLLTETSKECFPPIKSLASRLYTTRSHIISYDFRKWYISRAKKENTIFLFYTQICFENIMSTPYTPFFFFFFFAIFKIFLYFIKFTPLS